MAKSTWQKFNPTSFGAETPFQVRAGNQEATVVVTQHRQVVDATTRHLIGFVPEEMSAIVAPVDAPVADA